LEKLHEKVDVEANYGISDPKKMTSTMTSKVVKLEKSGRKGSGRPPNASSVPV
tara:strand:- start:1423 stop:1581 length:159 start_codon:yes stop_codon:yes gene_type:complete